MNCYVVLTGKGETWVTYAFTRGQAETRFHEKFPGSEIASICEAAQF